MRLRLATMPMTTSAPTCDELPVLPHTIWEACGKPSRARCDQLYIAVLRELEIWGEIRARLEGREDQERVSRVLLRVQRAFSDVFGNNDEIIDSATVTEILLDIAKRCIRQVKNGHPLVLANLRNPPPGPGQHDPFSRRDPPKSEPSVRMDVLMQAKRSGDWKGWTAPFFRQAFVVRQWLRMEFEDILIKELAKQGMLELKIRKRHKLFFPFEKLVDFVGRFPEVFGPLPEVDGEDLLLVMAQESLRDLASGNDRALMSLRGWQQRFSTVSVHHSIPSEMARAVGLEPDAKHSSIEAPKPDQTGPEPPWTHGAVKFEQSLRAINRDVFKLIGNLLLNQDEANSPDRSTFGFTAPTGSHYHLSDIKLVFKKDKTYVSEPAVENLTVPKKRSHEDHHEESSAASSVPKKRSRNSLDREPSIQSTQSSIKRQRMADQEEAERLKRILKNREREMKRTADAFAPRVNRLYPHPN